MSRGDKYIHVYEIELQDHEFPRFYVRDDDIITLCSDINYPYRNRSVTLIGSSSGRATRSEPMHYKCNGDTLVIPYFGVKEFEYEEVMKANIMAAVEASLGFDDIDNRSVLVVRHKFEDDIWEIGIATQLGYGGDRFTRNEMFEKHLDHMMKLKAFW